MVFLCLVGSLLAAPARAADRLHYEPPVRLELVHTFGGDHSWGVRLGMDRLYALGDACRSYMDTSCRTEDRGIPGSLWPVIGPAVALQWRRGSYFALDVRAAAGLTSAEMFDYGFLPYWELLATPGLRLATHDGLVLAVGGVVVKSLTPRFYTPTASTYALYGTEPWALRGDLDTGWRVSGGATATELGVGLQVSTRAMDLL